MFLENLRLTDFRNFHQLQLHLRPKLNFFLGGNGQGKTNLIEAVYLLSHGTSFRPVDAKSLLRNEGTGQARIKASLHTQGFQEQIEMQIQNGGKTLLINEKRVTSTTALRRFPTVLFSPESLSAIKDGPEQRRLLIDELMISVSPKQTVLISEYSRALKSRNRLLRNIAEGLGPRHDHELALESLNKIYLILSTQLAAGRIQALKNIKSDFQKAMAFISSGDDSVHGDISVDYLISSESALDWDDSKIYDALTKRLETLALQELSYGGSLVGPHKHDIKFLFNGNDSRFYCSQGQQRALILALKIAQIVYHHRVHQTYPVLLLDDVLSELDNSKRTNLMKFLEGISAQILITSTDLAWSDQFGVEHNSIFEVSGGQAKVR